MTPGALLLLLAVAASQVDFLSAVTFTDSGEVELNGCDVTFFGKTYTWMDVTLHPDSSFEVCFKNNQGEVAQDCLSLNDRRFANRVTVTQNEVLTDVTSDLHSSLSNFLNPSFCYVEITLHHNSGVNVIRFKLYNFGRQTALAMTSFQNSETSSFFVEANVNHSSMTSWTFTDAELFNTVYEDISACRFFDAILPPSSTISYPENCTETICDETALLTPFLSLCQPWEDCNGNNVCVPQTVVCTVTGSSVIDFYNQLHSVPDQCVYSLVSPSGMSDVGILAGFRERRLQDMPFLDFLILSVSGSTIYLEQGGRVQVNGQILTLSATPQLVDDVELSKDQTGVTARMPFFNLTVYFDGNTAHLIGLIDDSEGLCGYTNDSSQITLPSAAVSTLYSPEGCEIQYNDMFDGTSHCNRSTERCNLLWEAPFTACHDHIDPEPYISACTDTSCNYPDVDGLTCQFLEAYAKSCDLISDVTVEGWMSMASCSVILQDSCLDQHCSDHEFCGEKLGEIRCLCRALFAAKYEPTDALGEPTVCSMQNSATVTLAACLLWDKGIDYSTLHLNDPTCVGHIDEQTHMVTFSFNGSNTCGMEVVTTGSKIIYKNTIRTMNTSMDVITYYDQVQIDFSCSYTDIAPNQINSMGLRIRNSSVVQEVVSGVWNYTLRMSTYTDPDHLHLVEPETEIQLNQKIWLELKTEGLDSNMVAIVTESCWATSHPSAEANPRHDLIIGGCPNPADHTVQTVGNGLGKSNSFSFNMFKFFEENSELYLHCLVQLCPTQSQSCAPNCGSFDGRKRRSIRSKYADGNPALITMAWKK